MYMTTVSIAVQYNIQLLVIKKTAIKQLSSPHQRIPTSLQCSTHTYYFKMNYVLNGISNQEHEPVHDQGNSSPLVNEKAYDDSSDIRKKNAPKKKDKSAE